MYHFPRGRQPGVPARPRHASLDPRALRVSSNRQIQSATRGPAGPWRLGLALRSSEPEGGRSHALGKAALCGQIAHPARRHQGASNSKCVRRPFPHQTEAQRNLALCRPFDSGGGIRTRDLRVMRPLRQWRPVSWNPQNRRKQLPLPISSGTAVARVGVGRVCTPVCTRVGRFRSGLVTKLHRGRAEISDWTVSSSSWRRNRL